MPAILEYNPLTYNHINFLGRITQKSWAGGETTTYSYDPSSELVTRISSPGATQYFTYDSLYRISTTVDSIDNNSYSASYSYNQKGDIDTILYNSAVSVTNIYNNFGYLDEVKVNTQSVWNANTMNRYGIIDNFTLGNQATTSLGYDTNGLIDSILTVRNGTYLQRWNYEKEVDSTGNVRELYYISCSAGLVAILQRMNNQDTIFYIHTDHLGSFDVVTTQNGIVRERYNFDPWGRRRNPYDWSYNNISTTFLFDRGFTGHEHLDKFDLINMNGRVYDPLLGMFLSPDNYIQSPDLTQNFNRYGYCLNNPLKYKDPDGEFFIIDDFIIGFIKGLVKGENPLKSGYRQAANCVKIYGGLFAGSPVQILSRFTWELPQTLLGLGAAQTLNTIGDVKSVSYYDGATVLTGNSDNLFYGLGGPAMTLGSYIMGNNQMRADPNNPYFQHEYGHYLESQAVGWAYLSGYALPSLWGDPGGDPYEHNYNPIEQDANARAIKYFHNEIGDNLTWNFVENPMGYPGTNWNSINDYYDDPNFQAMLSSLIIKPTAGDYLSWIFGPIGVICQGFNHSQWYRRVYINHDYYNVKRGRSRRR